MRFGYGIELEVPQGRTADYYLTITDQLLQRYKGPLDVVVDLGAHAGAFSIVAVKKYEAKKVLSVEADLLNFDYLLDNIFENKLGGKILPFWGAVWDKSFEEVMIRSAAGDNSGQKSVMFDPEKYEGTPVSTIALKEVLSIALDRFDKIDFLKVDVEGSEWQIFNDQVIDELKKVNYIDLELHPLDYVGYFGEGKTNETPRLLKYFKELGFVSEENLPELEFRGYRRT